jgi:hypothetical protein
MFEVSARSRSGNLTIQGQKVTSGTFTGVFELVSANDTDRLAL